MRMPHLRPLAGERRAVRPFRGLSALAPAGGYLQRCRRCEITPQGHLVGARGKVEARRAPGLTQCGEGWMIAQDRLYWQGVDLAAPIAAGEKSAVPFGGRLLLFPDRVYIDRERGEAGNFSAPAIDWATVFLNRVFGIRGGTLLASSVGNENCWDDFQNPDGSPKENGAFTLTLQDAPFTALLPFQNHLVLFREGDFFELYGTRPSNFALTQVAGLGVKEPRHLTAFDDRLYFFSQNRVWLYQGGGVSDLLGHLGWRFDDCALQAFGGGLLIAAPEGVYLWQDGCLLELEEGLHCDRLYCEGGQVYGLDWGEGVCWRFLAGPRQAYEVGVKTGLAGGSWEEYRVECRGEVAAAWEGRPLGESHSREFALLRCFVARGGREPGLFTLRCGPDAEVAGLAVEVKGGESGW